MAPGILIGDKEKERARAVNAVTPSFEYAPGHAPAIATDSSTTATAVTADGVPEMYTRTRGKHKTFSAEFLRWIAEKKAGDTDRSLRDVLRAHLGRLPTRSEVEGIRSATKRSGLSLTRMTTALLTPESIRQLQQIGQAEGRERAVAAGHELFGLTPKQVDNALRKPATKNLDWYDAKGRLLPEAKQRIFELVRLDEQRRAPEKGRNLRVAKEMQVPEDTVKRAREAEARRRAKTMPMLADGESEAPIVGVFWGGLASRDSGMRPLPEPSARLQPAVSADED